jgi:cyclohexanone monooxygenase
VHLVDIKDTPIEEITPNGLRVGGEEYELDVIVFATGFDAFTGSFLRIDVRGRDGVRLAERWKDGPTAYLGLGIAGFPNLLTVNGPGNPAVLTNVPATIEHDVEWISDCIEYAERHGITAIEPTEEAEQEWARYTAKFLEGTLYLRANSWWLGANIPGKPRVFMAFVGGLNRYRKRCAEVAAAGYEGFRLTTSRPADLSREVRT